jgi:hypothetical protein
MSPSACDDLLLKSAVEMNAFEEKRHERLIRPRFMPGVMRLLLRFVG